MTKPRYTDEFRAGAIAWLEGAGYPDTPGALERVAGQLNVPTRTLRRWWTGESNPVPDNIVTLKKQELADVVKAEVYGILEAMGKTRAEASYKELATAGGIMIDKLQLLQGKPTAINEDHVSDSRDTLAHKFNQASRTGDAPAVPKLPH